MQISSAKGTDKETILGELKSIIYFEYGHVF